MKKIERSKSKIGEEAIQSNLETDGTEMKEKDVTMKVRVKSYQEPTRFYFSSPCLLSKMEDQEETYF